MAPTVIGLAIDVSGSMRESFGSDAEQRLRAVWRSLRSAVDEAVTLRGSGDEDRRLFGYLFGLQEGEVADLFALARLAGLEPQMIAERERLGDWYYEAAGEFKVGELQLLASALDRRPECGVKLRELLPRKPSRDHDLFTRAWDTYQVSKAVLDGSTREAIHYAQGIARDEARWLLTEGERTVPLPLVGDYLEDGAFNTDRIRELVFGETPLCRALALAMQRFRRFPGARKRLVVISDGVPTDGDPQSLAAELRSAGVAILSCFIAPLDVLAPRAFPTYPSTESPGATVMTGIASSAAEAPEVTAVFRKLGWNCSDEARLVLQANHSRLLDDLFAAALTH